MTAAAQATNPPSVMVGHQLSQACGTAPTDGVGESLTDEAREEAIRRADQHMQKRYADFARTRRAADLADAYEAWRLMRALIAGRSKDAVLRMEIRKGLI